MRKKWKYKELDEERIDEIVKKFDVPELLATVLVNRGIVDDEEIRVFLNPTRSDFHDPYLMPDMEIAVERIIKAIDNQEKVIIYGDYDVDGITSITVLKKFLKTCGLEADYYIPNRLSEGYGLNKAAIDYIKEKEYTLIITVDCGISGIEEIEYANSLGIETIVTDHHEPMELLPPAVAIVDLKRKDNDTYPFKSLAGCGVVFKLTQALGMRLGIDEKEYLKYLDIVCVGTISDIVPLVDENRVIAKLGLKLVEVTRNPGLKALLNASGYKVVNSNTISFGIAPRINACGRMGYEEEALKLFLTENLVQASEITERLNKYNRDRQEIEKNIYDEAIKMMEKEDSNAQSIVLGSNNWHHGVIGIVSSKITEMYFKPSILICFEGEDGKGSGRSIPGFDLHEALAETAKYLEKYGGHEMAVGLSLKKNNFNRFKEAFEKYVEEKILKPSGMMNTGFESTDKLAVGYQDIYDNAWTLYPGVGYSATGLISNVPDLLKWVDALCTNKLISEKSFKEMTTPYKGNYGYGFVVSKDSNMISHTGKIDKYNAALAFTKDENQIYIALSNYSNSSPINLFNNIQKTLAPFYG